MSQVSQAEMLVHRAILSSLAVTDMQGQEGAAAKARAELNQKIDGTINAMRECTGAYESLKVSLAQSDFATVPKESCVELAFNLSESASKLRQVVDCAWAIAPKIEYRQAEYCELTRQLECNWEHIDEIAEAWVIGACQTHCAEVRELMVQAEQEAGEDSDWRDFLATV